MPIKVYPFVPVRGRPTVNALIIDDVMSRDEISRMRKAYEERVKPWQERHEREIKASVMFIEFRYRNSPVMRKEDL